MFSGEAEMLPLPFSLGEERKDLCWSLTEKEPSPFGLREGANNNEDQSTETNSCQTSSCSHLRTHSNEGSKSPPSRRMIAKTGNVISSVSRPYKLSEPAQIEFLSSKDGRKPSHSGPLNEIRPKADPEDGSKK